MKTTYTTAQQILKKLLVGDFIRHFDIGDTWGLRFDKYQLVAHNIVSIDETLFNSWLNDHFALYHATVDKDYIAKCSIVAAHMRRLVTDIILDEACNLTIEFEHGGKLVIPTNTDIVDWQWCLNESGSSPYMDCIVGSFCEGEISLNENHADITHLLK